MGFSARCVDENKCPRFTQTDLNDAIEFRRKNALWCPERDEFRILPSNFPFDEYDIRRIAEILMRTSALDQQDVSYGEFRKMFDYASVGEEWSVNCELFIEGKNETCFDSMNIKGFVSEMYLTFMKTALDY